MEIYLIRHTSPAIPLGVCYGQSDIDITDDFKHEAKLIAACLPSHIERVISSPLKRCTKLAEFLFPLRDIELNDYLKEINFGNWELKKWDDIAPSALQEWSSNFVDNVIPGGESYVELHARVTTFFKDVANNNLCTAIISHGGVIRSILSHITNTSLQTSFDKFSLQYACVIKLQRNRNGSISYKLLK
jgi:alpha-ribazole phosphatase